MQSQVATNRPRGDRPWESRVRALQYRNTNGDPANGAVLIVLGNSIDRYACLAIGCGEMPGGGCALD